MKQLVEINLTTKTAKNWTPPEIRFGETLTIAMRFFQNSAGDEIATYLNDVTIKAAIGRVDARPQGGTFALKIGPAAPSPSNTTAPIAFNASASALQSALNATPALSSYGTARVVDADGSWLMFFGDQSVQVPLAVLDNSLWPVSFGRIHAWTAGGKWTHELRLTQSPVAFTSNVEVSLPKAPEISTLQDGGTSPDGTQWNEIQQLYVPPDFQGAFILKRDFAKTVQLSREDGISDIQEALQALGKGCFKVTLPLSNKPAIEFIGDYAGMDMSPLDVQVLQAPPPDNTFTLTMDRAELAALLRHEESVTLPLEIRLSGEDEGGFAGDLCALSLPVILRQPVIFDDLEEVPSIDWLRPHNFLNYVPFGENNILTGQHYYRKNVGGGTPAPFVINHGLDTEAVVVFVRENIAGGRQLVAGTDFSAAIDTANQVTVTALGAYPDTDAWAVIVLGAQTAPAWAGGLTVTAPQVVAGDGYPKLVDFMDNIAQRLAAVEGLIGRQDVVVVVSGQKVSEFSLPPIGEVLPDIASIDTSSSMASQVVNGNNAPVVIGGTDLSKQEEDRKAQEAEAAKALLPAKIIMRTVIPAVRGATATEMMMWPPRQGTNFPVLLQAVPAAEVTDTATVPETPVDGTVYRSTAVEPLFLPGGMGRKSQWVPHYGYFASAQGILYRVKPEGGDIYYPLEFERELWRVSLGADQMPPGAVLKTSGELQFRLSGAFFDAVMQTRVPLELAAQYMLTAEAITFADEPNIGAPTGVVTLGATKLNLSPTMETMRWALEIKNQGGAVSSTWSAYGKSGAADNFAAPMVLRLRLAAFDVDDQSGGEPAPVRGQIALAMPETKLEIALD